MKRIFLAVSICLATNSYALSFEDAIVNPGESVSGKHLDEYANMWWQWTYTMPKEISPVRDTTGKYCHVGQQGEVWFLAGGYGTSKIKRRCEIPQGKYIFFPVINMAYWPRTEGSMSCDSAKRSAALNNDELLSIQVELDSMKALNPTSMRVASQDCFNLLGLVPKRYSPPNLYPAATDGYWVMLKPLAKGAHILKFNAMYNREKGAYSKMAQDIEYKIFVK
ncbi:hypothetical protein [Amphritea atlantica]|nr:hypothetical protein [Amphritea atlantica]